MDPGYQPAEMTKPKWMPADNCGHDDRDFLVFTTFSM
jgi:hypothetical protein